MKRRLFNSLTLYLVGYLILVGGIAWSLHQTNYQAQYRSWQLCQNSNDARAAISLAVRTNSDQIQEDSGILIAAAKIGPQRQYSPADKKRADDALKFFQEHTDAAHKKALAALNRFKLTDCGKRPR